MRIRLLPAVAALLATAAACDEAATGPQPTEAAVTFEYRIGSAAAWSSFESRGRLPYVEGGAQAEGVVVSAPPPINLRRYAYIDARHQAAPGSWIAYGGLVPVLKAGDRIDIIPSGELCPSGRVCIDAGLNLYPAGAPGEHCSFTEGSYVLTRVTEAWLSATFVGRGACGRDASRRFFEVRAGSVEVPLTPMEG
jgi:hypothetical protein